jgi:RES domain
MPFRHCAVPGKIYRVSLDSNPLAFIPENILREPTRAPGRWDPLDFSYRVLYAADTLENAFIEVLFDFTQRRHQAEAILGAIKIDDTDDRSVFDIKQAIAEFLEQRYASSILVPNEPEVVKIDEHASLKKIAERLQLPSILKRGDLMGSELELPRKASKVVFDNRELGIACASALVPGSVNYSFFEIEHGNEKWSVDLVVHVSDPAAHEKIAFSGALHTLEIHEGT